MAGGNHAAVALGLLHDAAATHQPAEERLGGQVGVVLLGQVGGDVDDLEGTQLEAALLKAGDDLAHQATLRSSRTCVQVGVRRWTVLGRLLVVRRPPEPQVHPSQERTWTPSGCDCAA